MDFNYLKYIFKAKGRHGTHSPFVYSFVEEVLRKQGVYLAFNKFTKKERILLQLIAFLKIEQLYLFPDTFSIQNQLIQKEFPKLKIIEIETLSNITDYNSTLVLLDIRMLNEFNHPIIKNIKGKENLSFYIDNIYFNKVNQQVWNQVKDFPNFPMTLDFWFAGLLIQRKSFKIKQHFYLK